MKLTKGYIRKLIREELENTTKEEVLSEQGRNQPLTLGAFEAWMKVLREEIRKIGGESGETPWAGQPPRR